jgi:drug/metabolite transporter (DMT)-like permease
MWLAVPVMSSIMWLRGGRYSLDILRKCAFGGALFGVDIVLGFTSYQKTSITNATLIPSLLPVLVFVVAGPIFGEHPRQVDFMFGAVAVAGVCVVVMGAPSSGHSHLSGDLYAVATLLLWTVYFLEMKRRRQQGIPVFTYLAGVFLVGAITITPYALLASHDLRAVHGTDFLLLGAMVLAPGATGHGLMTWAGRHVDVTVLSLVTLLSPVVSAIAAWLIYSQTLAPAQVIGGVVVLGALAVLSVAHRPLPAPEVL